jgi:hypothetical protein
METSSEIAKNNYKNETKEKGGAAEPFQQWSPIISLAATPFPYPPP